MKFKVGDVVIVCGSSDPDTDPYKGTKGFVDSVVESARYPYIVTGFNRNVRYSKYQFTEDELLLFVTPSFDLPEEIL